MSRTNATAGGLPRWTRAAADAELLLLLCTALAALLLPPQPSAHARIAAAPTEREAAPFHSPALGLLHGTLLPRSRCLQGARQRSADALLRASNAQPCVV